MVLGVAYWPVVMLLGLMWAKQERTILKFSGFFPCFIKFQEGSMASFIILHLGFLAFSDYLTGTGGFFCGGAF